MTSVPPFVHPELRAGVRLLTGRLAFHDLETSPRLEHVVQHASRRVSTKHGESLRVIAKRKRVPSKVSHHLPCSLLIVKTT